MISPFSSNPHSRLTLRQLLREAHFLRESEIASYVGTTRSASDVRRPAPPGRRSGGCGGGPCPARDAERPRWMRAWTFKGIPRRQETIRLGVVSSARGALACASCRHRRGSGRDSLGAAVGVDAWIRERRSLPPAPVEAATAKQKDQDNDHDDQCGCAHDLFLTFGISSKLVLRHPSGKRTFYPEVARRAG